MSLRGQDMPSVQDVGEAYDKVVGGVLLIGVTGVAIYGVVKLVQSRDKGDERKGKGKRR